MDHTPSAWFPPRIIANIIAQTDRSPIVNPLNSTENLKTSGLKATLPRLRILELFERSSVRHLSAEDVYKLLQKEGTDTGLATVYRVLTQFEQAGLLIRHHFESDKAVFELNRGSHHDHLVCVQCGHVEEFYDAEIEKRQSQVAEARGFRIHDHSLHIYADCLRGDCPRRAVKS
jgi:Fur family ferric uptake transcriptional regulator